MKIRSGFVSNSSTSSFVCVLCGRQEAGYDLTLSEAGMIECVNGHVICEDEMCEERKDPSNYSLKEKKEAVLKHVGEESKIGRLIKSNQITDEEVEEEFQIYLSETEYDGYHEVDEKFCPICQMIEFSNADLSRYLLKKTGVTREEVFELVKQANKKRKKLYDNEYVMYVLQKCGIEMISLINEIKSQFKTYRAFMEHIR